MLSKCPLSDIRFLGGNMKVKLDHVNISVNNLHETIEWYGKVFGFELVESGKTSKGNDWGIIAINDSMICMTEYKEKIAADEYDDSPAHQIYHFGLRITDQDLWRQTLNAHQSDL